MGYEPNIPSGFREELESDKRDVADLWKDALKAYKGIVGFDLEKKFENVDAMISQGTKEMNNFHKFRHNEKKVDKLRSLFAANLDYLEQGTQQLLAAATPAFPPAAAIGTAVTYMLTACRQVSADYDVVVVFFEDMNSFLQRITILETRLPKYKAYENCLMDVFTSFLTMCGYAHKYIELGRFKKWISNLLSGEDSDLSDARKNMDVKLARLQNATEFAILSNTEELQKMSRELHVNQESHQAMLQEQMELMGNIRDTTESIRSDMTKLLKAFEEQQKKSRGEEQRNKLSGMEQDKPPSAKRIRNTLLTVEGEDREYRILKETMIDETCTWIFSEPQWSEWRGAQEPDLHRVLAVTGEAGTGKSHIGACVYDRLLKEAQGDDSKRTCAAHFYFREQDTHLSTMLYAVTSIIGQVVEQNSHICELINTQYLKDEVSTPDVYQWVQLFRKLLGPAFSKESKNCLLIMLDGIDELSSPSDLTQLLEIIKESDLKISVVLTGRKTLLSSIPESIKTLEIQVDKQKQLSDLKALIWNRLSTLDSLRSFSRYVKQRIADKVEESSPNMLYAQHLLVQLNALRREGAVLKRLSQPLPTDLHEIYDISLKDCNKRTGLSRQHLVLQLLHWTAFSFRPLVLDEVTCLLRYMLNDPDFDLEEIPEPFSRFIRVGDPGFEAEARAKLESEESWIDSVESLEKSQDFTSPDVVYNDGSLPVKFRERSMRSFFKEGAKTDGGLRWSASEANRQMFLDCAKFVRVTYPNQVVIETGLRAYGTQFVMHHLRLINLEEHSVEEQVEVMEAFATMMYGSADYARMSEWQDVDYKEIFTEATLHKLSQWAKLLNTESSSNLSPLATQACEELAENPHKCVVQLARRHIARLYCAADLSAATTSFSAFCEAMELSQLDSLLASQASKNFKSELGHYDNNEPLSDEDAVLGVEDIFDDIKMDATAYRAVATLLLSFKHKKPAAKTCKKAINLSETPLDKVKSLELMARIQLKKGEAENANKLAAECEEFFGDETVPLSLRQSVYVVRARCGVVLEKYAAAAKFYKRSRLVDPATLTAGNILEEELDIFSEQGDMKSYIDTLKTWSPLERLTWMAWKYEDSAKDRHSELRDAAIETNEKDFVIQMYQDSIRYLDNVNASAPLRCDLAQAYMEVCDNLEETRKALDEVLSSNSAGWPYAVTEEYPDTVLERAICMQTDVLYAIFSQSADYGVKAELLGAVEGLLTRPLALDVPPQSDTYLIHRRLVLARMYLKMGPASKFQSSLQGVIDACLDALGDTVGWNDGLNLTYLAVALTILGEAVGDGERLPRVARVLASGIFSRLDPATRQDDSEGEGDSESESESESDDDENWNNSEYSGSSAGSSSGSDDETAPDDEGDLDKPYFVETSCEGACKPVVEFAWWGGRVAYQCVICDSGFLCEQCHEKRQADNRGEKPLDSRQYCGKDHRYLKLPVEGWGGVKDGKLMMEGEEPIEFKEFLRRLRDEICKEAWESFWRG
ncbi:hypothetical protein BGZ63DRAFT_386632 [Mariannaea sp. PMI_226]|nr:hypothetical protein BGZ63DRAFT_386632 [Mariannaea sp. PMI_226]